MKIILLAVVTCISMEAFCQEDFIITLNGTPYPIALDKNYNFSVKGQNVDVKIVQKDTLLYSDQLFSFQYPKGFKVSNTKLDAGIEQVSILTAEGSGLLVQRYETMNPSMLNELMLSEMTKESISYGYVATKSTFKKVLRSGEEIDVTKAILRYKDEVNIYEIASIGKKDAGILIVTIRMDENDDTQGKKLIDLMWKSIKTNW